MATKTDMERLGVFKELGYTTVNDPYPPPNNKPFNTDAGKGKQMMVGGSKTKSALQTGYFDSKFNRIMEGEAYTDIVKIRRKDRLEQAKHNLSKSWTPTSNTKLPSGVGSNYGCFSGHTESFSATTKQKEKYKSPGRNFLTTPAKQGTGYGYVNVTIGSYQKYASEPYDSSKEIRKTELAADIKQRKGGAFKLSTHGKDYFDENPYQSKKPLPPSKESQQTSKQKFKPFMPSSPAKCIAGCKAGTFTKYPEHSKDSYITAKKGDKDASKKFIGGIFRPSPCPKSMPTQSVVAQNVHQKMNSSNFLFVK